MLKNKNSKLLFYHFKNLLNQQLLWIQLLRRTIIAEDKKGLVELQKQKWPYFIDMLLIDAIYNFKICRYCYNVLYSSVAYNFFDRVSSLSFSRIDDINEDIGLNGWGLKTDIQEYTSSVELLQPVDLFYQFNGRFLPEKELVHVLDR